MTNRRWIFVVAAVALGVAACGEDGGSTAAAQEPAVSAEAEAPTILAAGVGRASGPPDTMVVTLSILTDGATAAETLDTTSLRTQQLLDTARGQGVAEADLQTTDVQLYPRFDREGRRIVGYSSANTFTVRYRDLETAGGLLDQLVGVGGDFVRVQGLRLEVDDPTAILDEARDDAVERARAQAEQLAAAAGVELGELRTVREVPPGTSIPEYDALLAGAAAQRDTAVDVPIAEGSQELTVQVVVVYEIA